MEGMHSVWEDGHLHVTVWSTFTTSFSLKDGKSTYSAGSVNGQLLKQSDFHFYGKDNYFLRGIKS